MCNHAFTRLLWLAVFGVSLSIPALAADRFVYTATVGGGEVLLDPSGGAYANDTTVTATAQPGPGWAFSHWKIETLNPKNKPMSAPATSYDNPIEVTLAGTNVRVTAHFKGPKLTVSVTGQGTYSLDPPPPAAHEGYAPGQEVKVIFHPASGQLLTGLDPYVPPAFDGDPHAGWVFSHWSPSPGPAWQLGHAGLENPVRVVMDSDKTIYGTFIETGTTAHPTDTQEQELMDIARGVYGPWSGLTQAQATALFDKAEKYLADYKQHYELWGQTAGAVWYHDFGRTLPAAYDILGEGMTWTGMHLAAMALKHSVLPDCPETIENMNVALDAIDKCSWVTGTPGRLIRFSGPADDPAYQWYYSGYSLGAHPSAPPYDGEVWLGGPTRDVHTGVFTGLAAVLHFAQDAATREKARMLTERIVDRLVLDGWLITDGFRSELNNTDMIQVQMRVAHKANPTKYAAFLPSIATYPGLTPSGRNLYDPLYWDVWMGYARAWTIALLEQDSARQASFQARIRDRYNASARNHMNGYYAAISTFHDPGGLAPDAYATLQGWLLCHPDPPKRYWRSDLATDPRYTFHNSGHVVEAALSHHRQHSDFNGQRSAARTNGGDNRLGYTWSGWEVYLLYWMGRAAGAIPAP